MSNRLFQSVVHQMRDTIGCVIGVIDENAIIIACSELSQVGTTNEFVSLDLGDSHDIFVRDGYTYKPFGAHMKPDYAVFFNRFCHSVFHSEIQQRRRHLVDLQQKLFPRWLEQCKRVCKCPQHFFY